MKLESNATPDAPSDAPRRVALLGMGIDALNAAEVAKKLATFAETRRLHQIVTVNLDFLHYGVSSPDFRDLVNTSALVVPDGMPLLWAARYLGARLPERITGLDLIDMAVRHSQAHGSSLFFLGAAPGVAESAAERLRIRLGAFNLAGTHSPTYGDFDAAEDGRIRRLIGQANPEFLFVAFGCPKQDFWIRDHSDLGVPVAAGIGGAFNYLSGVVRRAPVWAQRRGLEWAFRLGSEPRRLAKRYLIDDVRVVGRLLLSRYSARDAIG
jgi:N-acetylglucosaminyldiphosphoundecaprenol N-acetyl-beta-D-mannosaminyltransferase